MKFLKMIRRLAWAIHAIAWCLFHGVKYKKGVYIGAGVKKRRRVTLLLSNNCRISRHTLFWGDGTVKLGFNVHIGSYSRIFASKNGGVYIGDYSMSASHLYIIDCEHGIEANQLIMKQPMIQKRVLIGKDVWMGYHTTILKGVTLEDGVVCGACSVVTKSFKKNSVIAGVPARVIKTRTS